MSWRSSRRRLRLRRKRKGETFASKLSDVGEVDAPGSSRSRHSLGAADAVDVVGHLGCCVVEAVGSLAVMAALLTVPAYLMLR